MNSSNPRQVKTGTEIHASRPESTRKPLSRLRHRASSLQKAALTICFLGAQLSLAWTASAQASPHPQRAVLQTPQESQAPSSASGGAAQQSGQDQTSPYKPVPRYRMLTQREESAIVKAAWEHNAGDADVPDCSHTVHQIYTDAGYEYPYASSFDLYRGTTSFVRVTHPLPGDLIAWPGHVGIVLSAKRHSFYSLVTTGLEAQNYRGAYWRGRGHPRFYRYILERTSSK